MNTDGTILEALLLGRKITAIKASMTGKIETLELDGCVRITFTNGIANLIQVKDKDDSSVG